jgi:hypothetical protein
MDQQGPTQTTPKLTSPSTAGDEREGRDYTHRSHKGAEDERVAEARSAPVPERLVAELGAEEASNHCAPHDGTQDEIGIEGQLEGRGRHLCLSSGTKERKAR